VGGVSVRFLDRHSYVYRTTTDSTGSYRLTGLSDGDYRAELTKEGFSENNGDPFSHVAGFVPVRVDAQLKPWAALGGRVVDEDLKPVAGVRVEKRP
jgi:protocatechuate 3,4-dioxygenase beta subunit